MNITAFIENEISAQHIIRCKQRLVATTEVYDADLAVCVVKREQDWSVVALEGTLVGQDWQKRLPLGTLEKTVAEQKGVFFAEQLGESPKGNMSFLNVVSTLSAISDDGETVVVIAKHLRKGVYKKDEVDALAGFLGAFGF